MQQKVVKKLQKKIKSKLLYKRNENEFNSDSSDIEPEEYDDEV